MSERPTRESREVERVRRDVAAYVAQGADESVQRVITAVHRLSRRLNQWYDRQLADLGVGSSEWRVLEQLARAPEDVPLTPSQLAAATDIAPSSMTNRLDRLSERGLIERDADPSNRTRVLVRLSDAGYTLYGQAIREANIVESDLLAHLNPEQVDALGELLEGVIVGLDDAAL